MSDIQQNLYQSPQNLSEQSTREALTGPPGIVSINDRILVEDIVLECGDSDKTFGIMLNSAIPFIPRYRLTFKALCITYACIVRNAQLLLSHNIQAPVIVLLLVGCRGGEQSSLPFDTIVIPIILAPIIFHFFNYICLCVEPQDLDKLLGLKFR